MEADETLEAKLQQVDAHPKLGRPQKTALRLIAEGRSYREAAKEAGLRSTADLRRHAERFGLRVAHLEAREERKIEESAEVVAELREVAGRGARELLHRLKTEPDSIQTRDLTVLTGVAIDKVAKWERWGEGSQEESGAGLGALLDRLATTGGTVSVTVSPREAAIDVTPVSSEPEPQPR